MTNYLEAFMKGSEAKYEPGKKTIDLGVQEIVPFEVPAEDRNRTSPFPYGGARFEFRAVGSAQNVSMVNTVLNTITAEKFKEFADAIDDGAKPEDVARQALEKHWKVIYNGDNYCAEAQQELTDRGLWRIDSGVDAIATLTDTKNVALFEKMGVLTAAECEARQTVLLDHYTGTVEMEALTMVDMINQHVIPSCKAAGLPTEELKSDVGKIKGIIGSIHAADSSLDKAKIARDLRLKTMVEIRVHCDEAEAVTPADLWTLATYKELLFLDSHTDPDAEPYYE